MFHHNTIRKYTLALLDFFNNLEVQYKNEDEQVIVKKIPVHYKMREKELLMNKTETQILTGNMNTLPRAVIELTSLTPNTNRQSSKYNKIHQLRLEESQEYQYNSVSYDFGYSLKILCRGMNEACQIVEQIGPKFNPNVALDIFDAENEETPNRIPLQMGSIGVEVEAFEEKSLNLVTVSVELTLSGYLFQPIKNYPLIKELKMSFNTPYRETEMLEFKVVDGHPQWAPKHTVVSYKTDDTLYLEAIKLVKDGDKIICIYDTNSLEKPKITFISENAELEQNGSDTCIIKSTNSKDIDICAILDLNNLHTTIYTLFYTSVQASNSLSN